MKALHDRPQAPRRTVDAAAQAHEHPNVTGEPDARPPAQEPATPAKGIPMRFVIYASANAAWYWELRDEQGTPLARSITGFSQKRLAMQNARAVRLGATRACLYDPLGTLLIERGL